MRLKPSGKPSVRLTVKENSSICFSSKSYIPVISSDAERYDGDYEFTPSAETQTIAIENKRATQNITINPIPQNYGLITWDGATLTVS